MLFVAYVTIKFIVNVIATVVDMWLFLFSNF